MMTDDSDYVERTIEEPTTLRREEVRVTHGSNNAGWWIAALVAIVAIVGVIFVINNGSTPADLQNARNEGAAQQALSTAASDAQVAASRATQAAQDAAHSTAQATETAAQAAADRTGQAARTATDAAQDAATTEAAPPQ
jgi:uncharacterized iron-regulated membrane protein